jgi:hypothetical protein
MFDTARSIVFCLNLLSIVKQVSGLVQSELADLHPSQILHVGDDMDKAQSLTCRLLSSLADPGSGAFFTPGPVT